MKQFVIFLLLCVPSMYGQNPLEGKWITKSLLCDFKEEDGNLFVLTQHKNERSGYSWSSGYSTVFEKNNKNQYTSYYFAPCDNDCFPSITGTFELIAPSYVRLNALKFEQRGFCENKDETLHHDTADYYIYKVSDKTIFLVKSTSKNEKEDQEKAKYLLVTGIKKEIVFNQKQKMKIKAKGIEPLPEQVKKYATNILQLKNFKILAYNQLGRRAAWIFAVEDLPTGVITYVLQEHYTDVKGKEVARFFDCTEDEVSQFRQ